MSPADGTWLDLDLFLGNLTSPLYVTSCLPPAAFKVLFVSVQCSDYDAALGVCSTGTLGFLAVNLTFFWSDLGSFHYLFNCVFCPFSPHCCLFLLSPGALGPAPMSEEGVEGCELEGMEPRFQASLSPSDLESPVRPSQAPRPMPVP